MSKGICNLLSFVDNTNRDARYTTTVLFKDDEPPAAGWFFDDVDWGVCGAIRQYSTDPAVTDTFLEDLYDGTVTTMVRMDGL